jgi:hypothetical protein
MRDSRWRPTSQNDIELVSVKPGIRLKTGDPGVANITPVNEVGKPELSYRRGFSDTK